MNVVEK